MAQSSSDLSSGLSALENKLFLHDYSSDTSDERLNRLETMVFGKQETGTAQARLKKLTTAIGASDLPVTSTSAADSTPSVSSAPSVSGNYSNPDIGSPPSTNNTTGRKNKSRTNTNDFTPGRGIVAEYGLGKLPPVAPPIDHSTSAMASLPPVAPPLADWVPNNFSSSPYSASTTSPSVPSYLDNMISKVDWLERTLFGSTYSDPLPVRILRLEGKVFPQQPPATNLSLTERVTRLVNAVSMQPSR